jgi:hypothetical protein
MFQQLGAARQDLICFLHVLLAHAANSERGRHRGALLIGRQRTPIAASQDQANRDDDIPRDARVSL